MRSRWKRLAIAAPTTIGVCYFALWACAPMFAQTPVAPIAGNNPSELGIEAGSGLLATDELACSGGLNNGACVGPQLQAYYRGRIGKRWELAGVAHGGVLSILGVGVQARYWFVDKRVRFGISPGVGWLYGSFGVPVAVRVAENTWVYTEPMAVMTPTGPFRVPIGISHTIGDVGIGVEVGGAMGQPYYDQRQQRQVQTLFTYGALRLSYAFGSESSRTTRTLQSE